MENYITRKNLLILIIALPIWLSSAISLYEDRNKIVNRLTGDSNTESVGIENQVAMNLLLEECFTDKSCMMRILSGQMNRKVVTFFTSDMQKGIWIDVKMYDALESDVHDLGENQSRLAENEYYKDAVCLNERGETKQEQ